MSIKPGNSVKVKEGIMCPDQEDLCLGGWQGRIFEIKKNEDGSILIGIKWDSITLKNMPASFIDQSEEEETDYATMYLAPEEVEPAAARDTEEISKKHSWSWPGEEGRRINEVLAGVEEKDVGEAFDAWENHFRKVLGFPFEAEIAEYQERGPLRQGDRVSVKRLSMADDLYGIIVEVWRRRKKYLFPLVDLEAMDKDSPNYQPVNDYRTWFANR
ncbi:MAG: calcium-binding protein [Bacillota bacterium]